MLLKTNGRTETDNDIYQNIIFKNDYVITEMAATYLLLCLQHCILNKECLSVNYNKSQKKCKLLSISLAHSGGCIVEHATSKSDDWDYYGSLQVYLHATLSKLLEYSLIFICLYFVYI